MKFLSVGASLMAAAIAMSSLTANPDPPTAKRIPHVITAPHGHNRTDHYYWLRERDNREVTAYLHAENEYTAAALKDTEALQQTLFEEIKGRIKQDESTVPYRHKNYEYYRRYREGESYPLICRRPVGADVEEIMFDVPAMAKGHEFYNLRAGGRSADETIAAFATDTVGRRIYTLRFKDLTTGKILPDTIENVTGNHAWANDNKTVFYSKQDPKTLRSYRIYRHVLGTPVEDDVLVYEETDETYRCYVFKTKSERFVVIGSSQTLSDEYRLIDADAPTREARVFTPRRRDHEYSIDHFRDRFYIRTNKGAKNFSLMSTPVDETGEEHWKTVIPGREDVYLSGFELFDDYLVAVERRDALTRIRIRDGKEQWHELDFGEPAYSARTGMNLQFDTDLLRFHYESLRTPESVIDYNMKTREKTVRKEETVLGAFDKENYVTERLDAPARDGTKVPISLVYRKGIEKNGTAPLLLYAYGSYGSSSHASFRSSRLSLLDRGFVFAIAHVRGGQEFGRSWYEGGKLMKKKNTFTDFIDCADFLVEKKYADPAKVFGSGGSAGGLLIGAVANLRPDRFRGLIADVPFVDVVTTMLDDTIPLTTFEYDEWGNPAEKEAYHYMLSYSPYDNVEEKEYPNLLVLAGLHDSQVQYWEPAKWVARLRHRKTCDNLVLLKTDMTAGHGGASGRFDRYKETALQYAFLLKLAK